MIDNQTAQAARQAAGAARIARDAAEFAARAADLVADPATRPEVRRKYADIALGQAEAAYDLASTAIVEMRSIQDALAMSLEQHAIRQPPADPSAPGLVQGPGNLG